MDKNIKNKNLTSFADHLDKQYGKRGTEKREEYEQGFEAFKLGALIQEMREEQHLTQEQLALKCGITKSYISRIENNGLKPFPHLFFIGHLFSTNVLFRSFLVNFHPKSRTY